MARLNRICAVLLALSLSSTPSIASAATPTAIVPGLVAVDYSLEVVGSRRGLVNIHEDGRIVGYLQDEPSEPRKKKSNTVIYVVGGLALLVGILYLIADNTATIPSDTFE